MGKQQHSDKRGHSKKSKMRNKLGKAPGTITYMGSRENSISSLDVIAYSEEELEEYSPEKIGSLLDETETKVKWINLIGLSDVKFIGKLGKVFHLNPLVLEDAVHTDQRPKIDEYDSYIFGVFKMMYLDNEQHLVVEHMALVLFEKQVLVFQELKDDVFEAVRQRIRTKSGHVRSKGGRLFIFCSFGCGNRPLFCGPGIY